MKKEELNYKMNLIRKLGGVEPPIRSRELEEDFDPKQHDKLMQSMFDESFYEGEEENASELDVKEKETAKYQENEVDIAKLETTSELPKMLREGGNADWWMCDGCQIGITENSWRFDCKTCENYTLCEKCRSTVVHDHGLKKI